MNDSMLMISNRMKNEFYVGVVGSNRSGKSTFLQSFFRLMVLPNITDEFLKQKIIDELPPLEVLEEDNQIKKELSCIC